MAKNAPLSANKRELRRLQMQALLGTGELVPISAHRDAPCMPESLTDRIGRAASDIVVTRRRPDEAIEFIR